MTSSSQTSVATTASNGSGADIAKHWIDGEWVESDSVSESINPATGEVLGRWADGGEAEARAAIAKFRSSNVPGDPEATGPAILKVVDAADPPLRIFFGSGGLPMTRAEYARRIELWEKWNDVSVQAQGDLAAPSR